MYLIKLKIFSIYILCQSSAYWWFWIQVGKTGDIDVNTKILTKNNGDVYLLIDLQIEHK